MKYTLLQQEDFKRTEQSFKNFPTGQKFLANYAHAIYFSPTRRVYFIMSNQVSQMSNVNFRLDQKFLDSYDRVSHINGR